MFCGGNAKIIRQHVARRSWLFAETSQSICLLIHTLKNISNGSPEQLNGSSKISNGWSCTGEGLSRLAAIGTSGLNDSCYGNNYLSIISNGIC